MEIYTIGVYNSTESEFFNKLIKNNIDIFIDIRRRRGVRGAKYSFVNSNRLQQKLLELNIQYIHLLDLAPTIEIRQSQKNADLNNNQKKRNREYLNEKFKEEYNNKILSNFNTKNFVKKFNFSKIVFFCVEENPSACHRSLVTQKIYQDLNIMTIHL